ncbi:hypothetical protein V6Z12_A09G075900 [Gossypium hirsutum]
MVGFHSVTVEIHWTDQIRFLSSDKWQPKPKRLLGTLTLQHWRQSMSWSERGVMNVTLVIY